MALKIRLTKPGKSIKRRYHFKIVVDESRTKRDGKFIEQLGFYNPDSSPKILKLDTEKYDKWIEKGARPTDTVASLYKKVLKQKKNKE